MYGSIRKTGFISTTCVIAVIGLAGCANTATNIDSGATLAQTKRSDIDAVVFGKLRLIRNGEVARAGEGMFKSSATLHFHGNGSQEITAKIGGEGEFAWALPPGEYTVSGIGFVSRGERHEIPMQVAFTVSADQSPTYIGTLTLEATLESGYYGLNGAIDRFSVTDDCATDCAGRLQQLGLSEQTATVALVRQEGQLAGTRRNQ